MEFSAKSAKQIFEVFLVYIVSYRFIFLQALSTDPERGMRVEELERLLAVETGGEELGARKFFVSTKKNLLNRVIASSLLAQKNLLNKTSLDATYVFLGEDEIEVVMTAARGVADQKGFLTMQV